MSASPAKAASTGPCTQNKPFSLETFLFKKSPQAATHEPLAQNRFGQKLSKGQSQPEIGAENSAFLILYMVLGKPF